MNAVLGGYSSLLSLLKLIICSLASYPASSILDEPLVVQLTAHSSEPVLSFAPQSPP